jgi:hypothetical protein
MVHNINGWSLGPVVNIAMVLNVVINKCRAFRTDEIVYDLTAFEPST